MMSVGRVPISSPGRAVKRHEAVIVAAMRAVLDSGRYVGGDEVAAFEEEFAGYLGAKYAVGVGSGTDALQVALRACGVGRGDRVATVSHTAVATVAAIELVGAVPVLVDVCANTFTMDPAELEGALEAGIRGGGQERIRAIVPVHLYGHPADMHAILRLAAKYGAVVVEDCAQAHGASINGRRCGTFGRMAAFSFYPTKNLGALGDGGAVVTNDRELAVRARSLREYGWATRYVSEIPGLSTRLDAIQAAVLRVKLKYLDTDNARRQGIARQYTSALRGTMIVPPEVGPGVTHAYHQYVVKAARRDALREFLAREGVSTSILYPQPLHCQPAYSGRIPMHGSLLRSERVCGEILSIPVFPELCDGEVEQVANALMQCLIA